MPTLNWIGKDRIINHHQEVPFRTLEKQYSFKKTEGDVSKIIQGDNLEALKALLPQYENRVKCIYIDPPYNTGNEGWVYNDNVNDPRLKKWLGQVVGKEAEDLSRHDKWLCMMYPRLKLLHKLLADDGAIFISIDDNEQANLKLIMDEIFGGGNFLGNIVWKKKTNGNNMGHIPSVHDFLVSYAKIESLINFSGIPFTEDFLNKNYANPDNDPRGVWTTTDLSANHKGPYFKIINPFNNEEHYPPKGRYWVFNEEEVLKRIDEGKIIFGKTGNTKPVQKVFLKDKNQTKKPETWWDKQGLNSDGTKEIAELLGAKAFDHSKPSIFIQKILEFSTNPNDIILDSFAGSGTTAHAVLNLNKAYGGNRQFILIEMNDYAETITAERVRRVIDGYGNTEGIGGGFDFYTLGEALFDEQGNLNAQAKIEAIREYIWFTETRRPAPPAPDGGAKKESSEVPLLGAEGAFLGRHNETDYYFCYDPNQAIILDMDLLATITQKASQYLIYADSCELSEEFLNANNIIFKKIPRDITRL